MFPDRFPSPGLSRPNTPPQPPNSPVSLDPSRVSISSHELPIKLEGWAEYKKLTPLLNLEAAQNEIGRLHSELGDARSRIERDTNVINSLHEKITELENLVQKQKVTISNQSKAISDRRNLRKNQSNMGMFPMTPHHAPPANQHPHHTHPQTHSNNYHHANSGPGVCPGYMIVASPFQTPQSIRCQQQGSSVFDLPPPKFELPFGGPSQLALTSPVRDQLTSATINNDAFINMHGVGIPGLADTKKAIADFSSRFLELMRKSEIFGQMHGNFPNIYKDSHLDEKVKEYVMGISNRTHASLLLGNPATRFCLVAKAVNFYLLREILTINVVKGFDYSVDLEIAQMRKQISSDTPAAVRHLIIMAMATRLVALATSLGFLEFCQQKIQNHAEKLWQYVGPLSHDPANQNGQAWADLIKIISEAQTLALDMHTVPLEYKFEFPEPGEQFDPLTMINRDPYILDDPQMLKNNDTRVRLGITPIVRIRDNSESPGDVKLMYLGNVLLRHARKQGL